MIFNNHLYRVFFQKFAVAYQPLDNEIFTCRIHVILNLDIFFLFLSFVRCTAFEIFVRTRLFISNAYIRKSLRAVKSRQNTLYKKDSVYARNILPEQSNRVSQLTETPFNRAIHITGRKIFLELRNELICLER